MKNTTKVFLLTALLLALAPQQTFAETASVKVNNVVNTSSSIQGTSTSKCHTYTESNGKIVESDDCNVSIRNEGISVDINNNGNTKTPSPTPTTKSLNSSPTPTMTEGEDEATTGALQKIEETKKRIEQKQKDFFQMIKDFLKKLFFG